MSTFQSDEGYMEQLPFYGDERQLGFCVYCGGPPKTRDHVPSRVLLDEPYPEDLPVVAACLSCNQSFSADEEYLACLLECVICGSTNPDELQRSRIRAKLSKTPRLAARLASALKQEEHGPSFSIEEGRVRNVVMKLARGHAAYELNEPQLTEPRHITFVALPLLGLMSAHSLRAFPNPRFSPNLEAGPCNACLYLGWR